MTESESRQRNFGRLREEGGEVDGGSRCWVKMDFAKGEFRDGNSRGHGDWGRGNSEIAGSRVRGMISAEEKSQRNRVEFLHVRKGMEVSQNVRR